MPEGSFVSASFDVPKPKISLWRRVRVWTVIGVFYAAIPILIYYAILQLNSAVRKGAAWDDRLLSVFYAVLLLLYPFFMARVFLRTKWTTGRWTPPKMTIEQRAAFASRRCGAAYNPPSSWLAYVVSWGNYTAMDATATPWMRALGWTILACYGAWLLFCLAVGIALLVLGLTSLTDSFGLSLVMMGFGAALLLLPGKAAWSGISRFQTTGSLRISQEEMAQKSEQKRAWEATKSAQPMQKKLQAVAGSLIVIGVAWGWQFLRLQKHKHADWFNPGLWTIFVLYEIWVQFRRPTRGAAQSNGASEATVV